MHVGLCCAPPHSPRKPASAPAARHSTPQTRGPPCRAATAAAAALPRRAAAPGARFRNRVRSRLRFNVLRHWLLDTFGAAALAEGSGVADIGGGGGDVAFELSAVAGVAATIVDPRQPCMWKCVKKLSAGVFQRSSLFDGGLATSAAHAAAHAVAPQHARIALTPPLIQALAALAATCTRCGASGMLRVRSCASTDPLTPLSASLTSVPGAQEGETAEGDCPREPGVNGGCGECWDVWDEFVRVLRVEAEHAEGIVWTKRGLQGHEGGPLEPSNPDLYEEASVPEDLTAGLPGPYPIPADRLPELVRGCSITSEPYRVADALLSCSLLLGLHPDQALGQILELAAALRKPFAVVPCCVYAAEFPRRRLRSGVRVQSYEQLLQWVAEWPGAQRCELPFSGRNTVFYSSGATAPPMTVP